MVFELLQRVGVVVALVASLLAVWWFDRPDGRWGRRLRERFVMGVPWGTLVVVLGVLAVYLFLQDGWNHWHRPVAIPYSSWSYLYPLGWLTAAFSHSGSSHVVGNLTATLVVMPLAEYVVGHFPAERGSHSFGSWRTNPWVRALVLFPLGVVVVGLATSLFSWGPIIGFSGVVFAAAGFALVRYPLGAVLALLAQRGVRLAYQSMLNPVITRQASTRFVVPGWAGIAVQGHALGLFLGAALGIGLLYARRRRAGGESKLIGDDSDDGEDGDDGALAGDGERLGDDSAPTGGRPSALRLWFGVLLAGLALNLWALWWFRGGSTFVLYRALGLGFVVVVALLITGPMASSGRRLVGELTRRQAATLLFLIPLVTMALVAVPFNLTTVADTDPPDGTAGVEVRDYTVFYAEEVPHQLVAVIDVSLFGESTQFNTSGVIVTSDRRHVWIREVPTGRLAHGGTVRVVLGGPGWREEVVVRRRGWRVAGGGPVYQVWIKPADGAFRHSFASPSATADPVLAGRNVTVVAAGGDRPADATFHLRVSRNGSTLGTVPIPGKNETATAGGLTFRRDGGDVLATVNGTRVVVATKETYN